MPFLNISQETWKLRMNMKQPDKVSTHGAQLTQAEGCGSNDPRAMKSSWTVEASPDWKRKEQHVKVRMGSFSYLSS